ncbi:MAG: methyltransferase domain-containing protein [Ferruginibacter sp.]
MINLSERSDTKELLDSNNIPFADIKQNLKELNKINTLLGGHKITIQGVKKILGIINNEVTICEIGCGGGDNLAAIAKWCRSVNIKAQFIGIDIKKECIDFAQIQYPQLNATWIVSDYAKVEMSKKPDIIFSSLFCHHFKEEELVKMLQWMQHNTVKGFFINDLQRHPLAYHSIKILTALFSRSYLVKNDAPLSVTRGFLKKDWLRILNSAGINASVKWMWAFRYLVVARKL